MMMIPFPHFLFFSFVNEEAAATLPRLSLLAKRVNKDCKKAASMS